MLPLHALVSPCADAAAVAGTSDADERYVEHALCGETCTVVGLIAAAETFQHPLSAKSLVVGLSFNFSDLSEPGMLAVFEVVGISLLLNSWSRMKLVCNRPWMQRKTQGE